MGMISAKEVPNCELGTPTGEHRITEKPSGTDQDVVEVNAMSDKPYEIFFSGEVLPHLDVETVKSNLVLMFDIPPEKVERLFCDQEVIVKRVDTFANAHLRQQQLEEAGLVCHIRHMDDRKEVSESLGMREVMGRVVETIKDHSRKSHNNSKFSRLLSSVIDYRKRA